MPSGFPVVWKDLLHNITSTVVDQSKHIYEIETRHCGPWLVGPYDVIGGNQDTDKRAALFKQFKKDGYLKSPSGKHAHHILLAADCWHFDWDRKRSPCVIFNKGFHINAFHSMESQMRNGKGYGSKIMTAKTELTDFALKHYKKIYTSEIDPPMTELWWITARMITGKVAIPSV